MEEEIDRHEFISKLSSLLDVADVQTSELTFPYSENFDDVNNILSRFKSGKQRDGLIRSILSVFGQVDATTPGTVGAHFKGCFVTDDACSTSCIESIQRTDPCEFNVIDYCGDGEFKKYNNGTPREADIAIINIKSSGFKGFTKEEVKVLNEIGITKVKLSGDTLFAGNEVYNLSDLEQSVKGYINDSYFDEINEVNDVEEESSTDTDESKNVWAWVILLIVFVFFILLILLLFNLPSA